LGENENFHRNGALLGKQISGESPEFLGSVGATDLPGFKILAGLLEGRLNPIN
jgi:hypothetical protein